MLRCNFWRLDILRSSTRMRQAFAYMQSLWLSLNCHQKCFQSDEFEENDIVAYPLPVAEPVLDMDGANLIERPGAGAGDGRGVHSDRSRDSSGRGTSVSSSETSTDTSTEVRIILLM